MELLRRWIIFRPRNPTRWVQLHLLSYSFTINYIDPELNHVDWTFGDDCIFIIGTKLVNVQFRTVFV